MTEEELAESEKNLQKAQQRKEAVKKGKPMPDTVEEFIQVFLPLLNDNPLLKEYITREHAENKEAIESLNRHFNGEVERLTEITEKMGEENSTIADDIKELKDNFNILASKLLTQSEERLALMKHAAAILEKELER